MLRGVYFVQPLRRALDRLLLGVPRGEVGLHQGRAPLKRPRRANVLARRRGRDERRDDEGKLPELGVDIFLQRVLFCVPVCNHLAAAARPFARTLAQQVVKRLVKRVELRLHLHVPHPHMHTHGPHHFELQANLRDKERVPHDDDQTQPRHARVAPAEKLGKHAPTRRHESA